MQLRHEQKETTWESHGWIRLSGPGGAPIISFQDGFQHNRNMRVLVERGNEVVQAAKKAKATFLPAPELPHAKGDSAAKHVGFLSRLWQRIFGEKEGVRFTTIDGVGAVGGAGLGGAAAGA